MKNAVCLPAHTGRSFALVALALFAASLTPRFAQTAAVAAPKTSASAESQETPAILVPLQWESDTLHEGVKAFLDVDYTLETVPDELAGKSFIRSNFFGTRKVCRQAGVVYAITPTKEMIRYSRAAELERIGFEKAGIPDFQPFGDQWKGLACTVYRKHLAKDERIDLGSPGIILSPKAPWCVIVAKTPEPRGKVGDLPQRPHSTFDPPLAQDYTIAARTPSLDYFIHDPGLIQLPSGEFLAISPCWSRLPEENRRTGAISHLILTKSSDGGQTWRRLADLPYAEATPFLAQGRLYLFTQPKPHEGVYFLRSDDGGETWTEAVKVIEGPHWNCQTAMVEKDGYLYWTLDNGSFQGTVAIAGDLSMDLLDPKAWRLSNMLDPVMTPPALRSHGTERYASPEKQAEFRDWNLEGNVMLVGGRLRIAARVNSIPERTPAVAALFDLEDRDSKLHLKFDQLYPWPGGQTKFAIVHDPTTHLFWMACNLVTGARWELGGGAAGERRYLMLYFGSDGMNWMPAGCIAMAPTSTQSFMYPSMVIDGDDLAILSRSGRESGHFHDANLSTFHRVKNFRSLAWY